MSEPTLAADAGQFTVERFSLRAFVNADASVGLAYDFTIHLHDHAAAMREVFFPLPHDKFDLSSVRATLRGAAVDLRQSRHGEPGFFMRFGNVPLQRTDRGKFHIELTLRDMIAADPRRPEHAIFDFELPRLAGMSTESTGDIAIVLHALPGIRPDELHASGGKNVKTGEFDGRATIAWRWPQGRVAKIGELRASFPRRGLHRLASRSPLGGPVRWLERHIWVRLFIGAVVVLACWFCNFRYAKSGGLATFLVVVGVLTAAMAMSATAQLVLPPALAVLTALGEWQRRRTQGAVEEEQRINDDIQVEVFPPEGING